MTFFFKHFFLVFILMTSQLYSQEINIKKHARDTIPRPLNALFFQLGAESLPMFSVNYERTIIKEKIGALAVRVGVGYMPSLWPLSFPLTIEQIFGKKHCGEIGFGSIFMTDYGFLPLGFFGYRFQHKHGIFRFDIAFVRNYDKKHFSPIPGFTGGFCF